MARFTCNFISYTLQRAVDITVIVPSVTIPEAREGSPEVCRHSREAKYPVLYLLHGYGNNHATWTGYTNAELYAEERNIAVVMLSAENKFYLNNETDRFFDFVSGELPDFVRGMFPVSHRPEDTYIAGLSMGGFGALIHGLTNPEQYAGIGAFSAAVKLKEERLAGIGLEAGGNDPLQAAARNVEAGKKLPPLYIACGEDDFLFAADQEFRDELRELGADITWEQLAGFGHEWRFWDQELEKFLDWIPRTDTYASVKKRQV